MPESIPVNFARHSYKGRASTISPQRLINLYPEATPKDDKHIVTLHGTPGLNNTVDVGADTGPIWAAHKMGDLVYFVANNSVKTIDQNNTVTDLGSLGTVTEPPIMTDNGTHVTIVNSGAGWYANASSLTQITDGDFRSPSSCDTLGRRTIFSEEGSDVIFCSELDDTTSYAALAFARAEGNQDEIVRIRVLQKELWILGISTTEVWYNSGVGNFPFEPIQGAFIERGCAAKHSVAKDDNALYWLGDDRIVYRNNGYSPEPISTHALEKDIKGFSTVSDARGFFYTDEGHKFYVLTFPTGDKTFVYDVATGLWHERQSTGLGRWQAGCYVRAFDKHLVGGMLGTVSGNNGLIFEMDNDFYQERKPLETGNTPIVRKAISPPVFAGTSRFIVSRFRLDIEAGIGLTDSSALGGDPEATLRFSKDGGKTWSQPKTSKMGKIGEYFRRIQWWALGMADSMIFEVTLYDPVKVAIGGAYMDIEAGNP